MKSQPRTLDTRQPRAYCMDHLVTSLSLQVVAICGLITVREAPGVSESPDGQFRKFETQRTPLLHFQPGGTNEYCDVRSLQE
ncbi:MAG: hypothetical protein QOF56_4223 [Acidobacteriaceae bacterium]|jgi:hypothetical protein|nr:hypothetical protein [Acidobacteriaceae bacterium]